MNWIPKTELGKKVLKGEITSMGEALSSNLSLRETEIVDFLLPDLKDKVLNINSVQRVTDSGRRTRFASTCVVGDKNGFIGIGREKAKEPGSSIKKAIAKAKLNIFHISRGCGSWECNCSEPHSLPFKIKGKSGSVSVTLKPSPKGINLAIGDIGKEILSLAGIKDIWSETKGKTKTTVNFALAVFNALKNTNKIKIKQTGVSK